MIRSSVDRLTAQASLPASRASARAAGRGVGQRPGVAAMDPARL